MKTLRCRSETSVQRCRRWVISALAPTRATATRATNTVALGPKQAGFGTAQLVHTNPKTVLSSARFVGMANKTRAWMSLEEGPTTGTKFRSGNARGQSTSNSCTTQTSTCLKSNGWVHKTNAWMFIMAALATSLMLCCTTVIQQTIQIVVIRPSLGILLEHFLHLQGKSNGSHILKSASTLTMASWAPGHSR